MDISIANKADVNRVIEMDKKIDKLSQQIDNLTEKCEEQTIKFDNMSKYFETFKRDTISSLEDNSKMLKKIELSFDSKLSQIKENLVVKINSPIKK